ncbi:MAG: YcbK family protein [Deltaproteobacteria bacterium]|nr:YcbK family protein [Deltaproteobacteria bacterium]
MNKIFLYTLFLLLIISPYSMTSAANGDGWIRLYNYHLNELKEIQFKKNGKLIEEAYQSINEFLRSRDNSEATLIDPLLLDRIDFLQDHFQVDTIEIISGYRRKEFNNELLKNGHKVSPVSLHTQGKAMDIHIDEISEETLKDFIKAQQWGGLGYYGPLDFVHLDTGPVRYWEEPLKARKLIGVLKPEGALQLTSSQNDYFKNEKISLKWSVSKPSYPPIKIERYFRGQWKNCGEIKPKTESWELTLNDIQCSEKEIQNRFGKYRLVFILENTQEINSSNEFYLKKE